MGKKIFVVLFVVQMLFGCRKVEVEKISAPPMLYTSKKLNGIRNWSGTYEFYPASPMDTSLKFEIKSISESTVVANRGARVDTMRYVETNELAKTIVFSGATNLTDDCFLELLAIYYYEQDKIDYEEWFERGPYGHAKGISKLILHSH